MQFPTSFYKMQGPTPSWSTAFSRRPISYGGTRPPILCWKLERACFCHFDFHMCFPPQRRAILMPHPTRWLRTRRFSEPTLRPSGITKHWSFATFLPFRALWSSFFLLSLLWLFPSLIFLHLSISWKVDFKTSLDDAVRIQHDSSYPTLWLEALGGARKQRLRGYTSEMGSNAQREGCRETTPQRSSKNPPTPHRFGGEGVLIGGQNSNTKCSMTFVNIAVAISALAGGGQKRFRTETRIRWCFRHFSRIFGCLSARGYWNGILGHFGSFPAMEKRPKMKKNIVHSKILQGFWMPEHWKHCKNKCFGLTL